MAENGQALLDKGALISVGSALAIMIFIGSVTWSQATWQASVDHKITSMAKDVEEMNKKIVGRSENGWHKHDMRAWARELKVANPSLTVPKPSNEFDR